MGIIMSGRKKMSEHDILGLIAVLGIVIPALLFAAYVSYDMKKRERKEKLILFPRTAKPASSTFCLFRNLFYEFCFDVYNRRNN